MSKKKLETPATPARSTPSSTREAVESSIDLSKSDNFASTWEELAVRGLTKVSRWEDGRKRPASELPEHT